MIDGVTKVIELEMRGRRSPADVRGKVDEMVLDRALLLLHLLQVELKRSSTVSSRRMRRALAPPLSSLVTRRTRMTSSIFLKE